MPTRAVVAILATIVGVVLLFSFSPPAATSAVVPGQTTTPAPTGTPTPAASGGGTPPPTPATSGTPTPSAASSSAYRDGTYQGQDYPNQYGDVQVKVIVSGGRISDVQPLQLPTDRARSAEISQQAAPLLHDEVIQAQSANIDILSGATFTSESYAQSVQSALDQAHR